MPENHDLRRKKLTVEQTEVDLDRLLSRIEEAQELVRDFRAVVGSNDLARVRTMMLRVLAHARSIEPELSDFDGATLSLMLLKKLSTGQ